MVERVRTPSFEFGTAARIVFGVGRVRELSRLVAELGSRPLVCTGANPDRHADLIDALPGPVATFSVAGEPTVEVARQAVAAVRRHHADVVVAIGGGSALDLGKAAAVLAANDGDPLDYLEVIGRGAPLTRASIPVVAVPTTAGTGSEVTANAVLASPEHQRKVSLRGRGMLPAVALVDPEMTVGCSPAVTAASGLDALTQCLEPLVSVLANPFSDALTREGLRRAASGLRRAYLDGTDIYARTDMSVCSLLSGIALANSKLGAVHGFAGVIGGMTDAAHGAICAALLAPVIAVNVRALGERDPSSTALAGYAEAGRLLTGDRSAGVPETLDWIRQTVRMMEIPSLGQLGVRVEQLDDIVASTRTASSTKGNPIELTDTELTEVLHAAMADQASGSPVPS